MKNNYSVYAHINKINGKIYIGITRQRPERRWQDGKGYKKQQAIGRAVEKYGWDSFDHIIIADGLSPNSASEIEKVLIAMLDAQNPEHGYNLHPGGADPDGKSWDIPARERMSKLHSGKNNWHYGQHWSDEVKKKIGDANRGRHYGDKRPKSEETKRKMSEGKMKPVWMCDRNDPSIKIKWFRSSRDAADFLHINYKNISLALHGARKVAGGYAWQFA